MNLFQSDLALTTALGYSVLGMAIVFLVLIMLIGVVKILELANKKKEAPVEAAPVAAAPVATAPAKPAPGTAGELKLYNVEERDAAMVMAIVADKLGKPLNELRFISIREVTE